MSLGAPINRFLLAIALGIASTVGVPLVASDPLVLIVDPAHDSKNPGVVLDYGGRALTEQFLVLRVARELSKKLRVAHRLTRADETGSSEAIRVGIANNEGGDLFLSLHAAFDPLPLRHGLTLVIPEPKSDCPLENERWISVAALSCRYEKASRRAAEIFKAHLSKLAPVSILEMDLSSMQGLAMPAVALELGFLSNSDDRDRLQSANRREMLIAAIASAVQDFFAESAP